MVRRPTSVDRDSPARSNYRWFCIENLNVSAIAMENGNERFVIRVDFLIDIADHALIPHLFRSSVTHRDLRTATVVSARVICGRWSD
jgi:hypothetical protein